MPATKTRGRKSKNKTETLTVKWILQDKGMVKFEEKEDHYDLSDAVADLDLAKFGIGEGTIVEAQFDKEDTVVFLKKVKDAVKEDNVSEVDDSDVKTWTIAGIPASKEVIKFKEDEKTWYPVSNRVKDLDFDSLGIKARANVKVTFGKSKKVKGKEVPVITYLEVVKGNESVNKSETSSTNVGATKTVNYGDRNTSIEKQCSWKTAGEVVSSYVATNGNVEVDEIVDLMKTLAQEGIKFIQG